MEFIERVAFFDQIIRRLMDAEAIVGPNTTSIWEIAFFHAEYCKINCTHGEFMFDKKEICSRTFFCFCDGGISDGMGVSEHGKKFGAL